ncbi:MAG: hypothetical protein P8Z30_20110, partial [Acidobacteriota bacterium]
MKQALADAAVMETSALFNHRNSGKMPERAAESQLFGCFHSRFAAEYLDDVAELALEWTTSR